MLKIMLFSSALVLLVGFIQGCGGHKETSRTPGAFLSVPLEKGRFHITQGWIYGEDERIIHPDMETHFAVDFAAERGTPVYAAADGFAIASYHLTYLKDGLQRVSSRGSVSENSSRSGIRKLPYAAFSFLKIHIIPRP